MYISLYVVVNTFIGGRQPQNKLMRLRTFKKDTIADMDPVDLIIASLDVKGAFPNTPWLLLEAVWKRLGLPFYNFASGYIRTANTRSALEQASPPCWSQAAGSPKGEQRAPSCTF